MFGGRRRLPWTGIFRQIQPSHPPSGRVCCGLFLSPPKLPWRFSWVPYPTGDSFKFLPAARIRPNLRELTRGGPVLISPPALKGQNARKLPFGDRSLPRAFRPFLKGVA